MRETENHSVFSGKIATRFLVGEAPPAPVKSTTMCLPARCTRTTFLPSSAAAIAAAGDFRTWGRDPIHTDSIVSPVIRLSRPRTMVSTSGSSGMEISLQMTDDRCRLRLRYRREPCLSGKGSHLIYHPTTVPFSQLPLSGLPRYHYEYTARPDFYPCNSAVWPREWRMCATLNARRGGCANFLHGDGIEKGQNCGHCRCAMG